jgi:type II secretory pathway pseudopilin PulG
MRRGLKLRNYEITKLQNSQRGYMMLTLVLALALITIALLTVLPDISQQVRRDREDELRHRGTAYMRAIQHFYKKFGRYPSRIEELENTNNMRFLRKRYTDPMNRDPATGKERDFKLLHQQDITLNNGPLLGQIPGQSGLAGQGGLPGQGGPGGMQGGLAGLQSALGGLGAQTGVQQTNLNTPNPATGESGNPDSGNPSSGNPSDATGNPNAPGSSSSSSSSGLSGQTFGGGPILGVASLSKAKTIRVFSEKTHYNDWLFIYVPQADRGGLLTGPVSLNGPTSGFAAGVPGQGGLSGQGQGLTPNSSQPQNPPAQPAPNSGQTAPQQ